MRKGEYLGGGRLRKSKGAGVQKRNLERQKTTLDVYAGSGHWVIWPLDIDLTPENIKDFLKGTKIFLPDEVRGWQHTNQVLVFNFDTGVGVEVTFQK